jgi:serine protease AprX
MTEQQKREERASALWGTSAKGGKGRANAMWGGRARGAAALFALAVGLSLPAAGLAAGHHGRVIDKSIGKSGSAYVPAALLADAKANPRKHFQVIVQTDLATGGPADPGIENEARADGGRHKVNFHAFSGGAYDVTGRHLVRLATQKHVTVITPDSMLKHQSYEDSSMWRETAGLVSLAGTVGMPAPQAPAIAIVDSGIDATKAADFGGRVVASMNFSSLSSTATGDDQGHGTMVAGIAAGSSADHPGAAANANLVDLRTSDANGQSLSSDVIAAIDWILSNKDTYNIRVANFSMAGRTQTTFRFDPLDRAVEKLWFAGIVVVAAAGNHGTANTAVDMSYAPGNDPFVITVGATDQQLTADPADDTLAPWSMYGHTVDGFSKPDLSAPGRFLIMPVPVASTIATALPDRVVAPGYMWMSGTSFSAPAVAGAAAQLLALHPGWTPDQVKGALMVSASYLPNAGFSGGVGELNAAAAADVASPPNPNVNLNTYVELDALTGEPAFNQASWSEAAASAASWSSANWSEASWSSASWASASWSSASWSEASWSEASWSEASWSEASWSEASWSEASWAE